MEKFQEEKVHSNPYFTHSIDPTLLSFGLNTDGFEILVCHLFYQTSTERGNGLL